jgi:hypothetical protein
MNSNMRRIAKSVNGKGIIAGHDRTKEEEIAQNQQRTENTLAC